MINLRKNSGITLIALIITIIVLLILAGVALNTITRGNIIENANNAVNKYNNNSGDDQNLINEIDSLLSQYSNGGNLSTPNHQPTPGVIMTCTLDPTEDMAYGDVLECEIEIENGTEFPITDITITSNLGGQELSIQSIPAGESRTVSYNYTITHADLDAGEVGVLIVAEGTTTDPDNSAVYTEATATLTMEEADSRLSCTVTASPHTVTLGDTITYTAIIRNEGNVTVTNGSISDDHADLTGRTFELAPGQTAQFTYTYVVTVQDVNAGHVTNWMSASATAVRGDNPEEIQGTATVTCNIK